MAEFTTTVHQNEFLPDGGTDVHAIVSVTCTGAGTVAPMSSASGEAGEIIIVDVSGSMDVQGVQAAAYAASAALDQIVDGVWFAVDATALAPRQSLIRIATGRDASDTAFLSSSGGWVRLLDLEVGAVVDELPTDDVRHFVSIG